MTYITSTDRILDGIPTEDRQMLAIAANREKNMTGGRYSDALRAQRATYERLGSDGFAKLHDEATRIVRQLGY